MIPYQRVADMWISMVLLLFKAMTRFAAPDTSASITSCASKSIVQFDLARSQLQKKNLEISPSKARVD